MTPWPINGVHKNFGGGVGGGGHPDPEIRGGGRSPKIFFSARQSSVWSKNKGGGGQAPGPPPLDLPLVILGSQVCKT